MNDETEITESALATAGGGLAEERPTADALRRLTERAGEEGLLDVAYAQADSPFGPLTVAMTPRGLVRIAYPEHPLDGVLTDLATRVSPRVLESPARLDGLRRELDEYFAGKRRAFDTSVDWSLTRGFFRRVLEATAAIPFGEARTYAEIAAGAGSPRAVRATGNGLGSNPIPIVVPCHRVLRTGGGLGGYTGGVERKRHLLELEQD